MRALAVSFLVLVLLTGIWFGFHRYSESTLEDIRLACSEKIMPAIESDHWEDAHAVYAVQMQEWQRYKKAALYMLETDQLNDVDTAFAKTLMYIKAKDLSNSSGELLALQELLKQLHENECLTFANIL